MGRNARLVDLDLTGCWTDDACLVVITGLGPEVESAMLVLMVISAQATVHSCLHASITVTGTMTLTLMNV